MIRLALAAVLFLLPSLSLAQTTAGRTVLGYITTSGCPSGASSCFVPYDTTGAGVPIAGSISVGSVTSSATASATPTAVVAGTGKPFNISLYSEQFVAPSIGGTPVSLTAPMPGYAMLYDGANAQRWLTGVALADGVNGNNSGTTIPYVWNGTTFDRMPGNTSGVKVQTTACTAYHLSGGTGASTNANTIKASAGTLCDLSPINTSTTIAFLKVYNLATNPTCSSATGLIHVFPIPPAASAGQAGGFIRQLASGETYSTGIAFCVTGGGGDTDNTSAPTGVYIEASYR